MIGERVRFVQPAARPGLAPRPQTVALLDDAAPSRPLTVPNVPEVHIVMPLKNKGDFLMHGVVLQSRESAAAGGRAGDVSRETFLRKTSRIFAAAANRQRRNPCRG